MSAGLSADEFHEAADRRSGTVDEDGECSGSVGAAAEGDVQGGPLVPDGALPGEHVVGGNRKRSLSGSKKRPGSQGKHYIWTLNNPTGEECDKLRALCEADSRITWLAFSTETGKFVGDARESGLT